MKAALIQPLYGKDTAQAETAFRAMLSLLDEVDASADVIVLPEYSNLPVPEKQSEEILEIAGRYQDAICRKAAETASRCHAIVFANLLAEENGRFRNTTYAFDRNGAPAGSYLKAHPASSEERIARETGGKFDVSYSMKPAPVTILTIDNIRFAFLTCYDFYMHERFPVIAKEKPDVLIGCSLQRTDPNPTIELMSRSASYETNAYLLRSSYSLGADSATGGSSMAVSPDGRVMLDMKNEVGIGYVEFDPSLKYEKPAGFGGAGKPHPEYESVGRRPWLYLPGGPMTVPGDRDYPYPRVSAHRGIHDHAPENSLPAYGAAVSLGADEIEFDVRATKDGVLVSIHDSKLERVSNGAGRISDYTYEELKKLDFGTNETYRGLKILTFEEILRKYTGQVIMNIHVKLWDKGDDRAYLDDVIGLIRKYHASEHGYIMSINTSALKRIRLAAPEIALCQGHTSPNPHRMVDEAIENGFEKIQFFAPYFYDPYDLKKAKEHDVRVNYCDTSVPSRAVELVKAGVDTIMTNNYYPVALAIDEAFPGVRYHA